MKAISGSPFFCTEVYNECAFIFRGAILTCMETIEDRLNRIEEKLDATFVAAEKSRKYLLTTLIVSIAVIVLPLIAMAFMLPSLMGTLGSAYGLQ